MGKKLKLDLEEIKIQSFVTALDDEEAKRMKGGASGPETGCEQCDTDSGGDDDCCITAFVCGESVNDPPCGDSLTCPSLWDTECEC